MVVGLSWIGAGFRCNASRPLRYKKIVPMVVKLVGKTALQPSILTVH